MDSPLDLKIRSWTPFQIFGLILGLGIFMGLVFLKAWILPVALLIGVMAIGVAMRSTFLIWFGLLITILFVNNYSTAPLSSFFFWGFTGIFLFSVVWHQYISGKPVVTGSNFFWAAILGWYVWGALSAIFSPDRFLSIKEMARYGMGFALLFAFIQWLRDEALLLKIIRILWVCLIIYSVLMIAKILLAGHSLERFLGNKWHTLAESASFLAAFLPIFISLFRRMRGPVWMNGLGVLIIFMGVVFSDSDSALLAVVAAVVVLLGFRSSKVFGRVMILSTLLISGLFILGAMNIKGFTEMFTYELSGRERIWPAAVQATATHPLLGVGPGEWTQWFSTEYRSADFIFDDKKGNVFYLNPSILLGQAHNLFLTKAAEMGIPSFLLLLCVFVAWFLHALSVYRSLFDSWQRDLVRGCLASFVGLTLFCFFENGPIIGAAREGEIFFVMMVLAIPLMMGACQQGAGGVIYARR